MRIAAVGDNCVDVYVGDHEGRFPGGNALNVAALCAQDGLESSYFGTLGDDAYGAALLGAASAAGVDVSSVERDRGPTGVTTVRLAGGEREFISEEYGISASFAIDEVVAEKLSAYDWVHLSRVGHADAIIGLARSGVPISRDFGTELREGVGERMDARDLEVAFFSAVDRAEAEEQAAVLVGLGARLGVGTIGSEGAIAVGPEGVLHQPAHAVKPVDTLGAGDAFIAGFIAATLSGDDLEQVMRRAAEAAAQTCARLGAWGALDTSEVSS